MEWYRPFLFGLNLFCTVIFILIPILSVLLFVLLKRKFLWIAPLLSTALVSVLTLIVMGPLFWIDESIGVFFYIIVPVQFIITVAWALLAYAAVRILRHMGEKRREPSLE